MPLFSRTLSAIIVLLSCQVTTLRSAAQPASVPVYARQRGVDAMRAGIPAGGAANRGISTLHRGSRFSGQSPGYYQGYPPFQQVTTGSWYSRPYPYHFDYYRQRYSAPTQAPDCPCAEAPSQ